MFLIGSASQKNITVLNIFKAEMKKIVAQTVEVCQLGVLVDGDVLYLAKEDSPEPIRLVSFVGKRLPAYCTAIGKALLSDYTYKELSELYPDPLRPLTEKPVPISKNCTKNIRSLNKTVILKKKENAPLI